MFEVGPNVYKFTHRTFLEYFLARHLLSSSESIDGLIRSELLEKVKHSQWDVIAHLALQTAVFRDAGKMLRAADTLSSILAEPRRSDKEQMAFLMFLAGALEYLLLPEGRYYDLVRETCEKAIKRDEFQCWGGHRVVVTYKKYEKA